MDRSCALRTRARERGLEPAALARGAVMIEVILVLPSFILIFLGVMVLSLAFQQKLDNRAAARHVGEAHVY